MIYIDTVVFATSLLSADKDGLNARKLIERIETGKINAFTSLMTTDELMWVIKKNRNKEYAADSCKSLLQMPHLKFIDITKSIMIETIDAFAHTNLKPRDALHYATMKQNEIRVIVSEDSDFDSIEGIKRINITEALALY